MTAPNEQPHVPLRRPGRAGLRRVLLLCVIFISGLVVGAGLTICTGAKDWPRPPKTLEERRDALAGRIGEKLRFSEDQRARLGEIIGQRMEKVYEIQRTVSPAKRVQAELLYRQIRELCTDQQKPQWDELYARLEARWFQADNQPATQPAQ